jgi:hypothetical protein
VSRIFDFTIAGVIVIIAAVIHRAAVELFAPESPLHEIASDGTGALNGAQRADLWFEILAIWVPILTIGGIIAWIFLREYRRQVATAVRRP